MLPVVQHLHWEQPAPGRLLHWPPWAADPLGLWTNKNISLSFNLRLVEPYIYIYSVCVCVRACACVRVREMLSYVAAQNCFLGSGTARKCNNCCAKSVITLQCITHTCPRHKQVGWHGSQRSKDVCRGGPHPPGPRCLAGVQDVHIAALSA